MQIKPHDRFADIGCGTGNVSAEIYSMIGLKSPVFCVDCSSDMLLEAGKRKGIMGICQTAEQFASQRNGEKFDRILMKDMIHHIPTLSYKHFFMGL